MFITGMVCGVFRSVKKSWFGVLLGGDGAEEHDFIMIKDRTLAQCKADLIQAFLCVRSSCSAVFLSFFFCSQASVSFSIFVWF